MKRLGKLLGYVHKPHGAGSLPRGQLPSRTETLWERIRQRRHALNLSRHQLARETHISAAVLEALEQGHVDQLPEPAYLRTILRKLALRLQIPAEELEQGLLVERPTQLRSFYQRNPLIRGGRDFFRVEVLNGWQGVICYALAIGAFTYALNLQQRRLAQREMLTFNPLPALPLQIQLSDGPLPPTLTTSPRSDPGQDGRQPPPSIDGAAATPGATSDQPGGGDGLLLLELRGEATVMLSREGQQYARFRAAAGSVSWQLVPPFVLTVMPPDQALVRWQGVELPAQRDGGGAIGTYRVSASAGPRS
ncbi:MAG: helix-turn-helix domain-containing protein [Aphanocapsa feldmannii 288cV]|nr:MAG: helix-turn-helix domain-containing protein [Aphanocapsa feldmannii 288cV]